MKIDMIHSSEISRIAQDFSITSDQLSRIIYAWDTSILEGGPGPTTELLRELVRTLRSKDSTFLLSLSQRNLRKLISELLSHSLVRPKPYPKERSARSIDGRRYIRAHQVSSILSLHLDKFRTHVRKEKSVESGYRNFVDEYNRDPHDEYLPVSWESLSYNIRVFIRGLLGVESPNEKITDIPDIRFSSREEVLGSSIFREAIIYSLIQLRLNGEKNFLSALRSSLVTWNTSFSSIYGLKVPISIRGATPDKMSFQKLIGSPDRSIHSLLSTLGIDPKVWLGNPRIYSMNPLIHSVISSKLTTLAIDRSVRELGTLGAKVLTPDEHIYLLLLTRIPIFQKLNPYLPRSSELQRTDYTITNGVFRLTFQGISRYMGKYPAEEVQAIVDEVLSSIPEIAETESQNLEIKKGRM